MLPMAVFLAALIAVTVVLALAANTSFGGPPVLMSLLSDDGRLPHLSAPRMISPSGHESQSDGGRRLLQRR
jgi:hypothetical protein